MERESGRREWRDGRSALRGVLGRARDEGMPASAELVLRARKERVAAEGLVGEKARLGAPECATVIVFSLSDASAVAVSTIIADSGLSASSVSRALRRLESEGFVRTAVDPHDKRRVVAFLLPRGTRLAASLFDSCDPRTALLSFRLDSLARVEGLGGIGLALLAALSQDSAMSVGAAARSCSCSGSSASYFLDRLERDGLVERLASADGRMSFYGISGVDSPQGA